MKVPNAKMLNGKGEKKW